MIDTADTQPKNKGGRPPNIRTKHHRGDGVIDSRKAYSGKRFCWVLGCNWHSFMKMRDNGLKVCKEGQRVMVRGCDYLDYLGRLGDGDASPAPTRGGSTAHTEGSPGAAAQVEAAPALGAGTEAVATDGHLCQ